MNSFIYYLLYYSCDDGCSLTILDEFSPSGRRDFDNTPRTIVFRPRGTTSQMVQFPVFDDAIDEEQEGFIILLDVDESHTDHGSVFFTECLRVALVMIFDNDRKH